MKKLVSFMLVFGLVAGMSTTAMAADLNKENASGNVTLTYAQDESYKVTIPADFTLTTDSKEQQITAMDVYIPSEKTLKVTVSSENYNDNNWYVKNSNLEKSDKVKYTIKKGEKNVGDGEEVLTCAADADSHGTTETLALEGDKAKYADTYTDTLTFTVTVE